MQSNPTFLLVVAAAIRDSRGKILMHRRPPGKAHAGLWEFPGGKVEANEIPAEALVREVEEELGLHLGRAGLSPAAFAETPVNGDGRPIVILLYTATEWRGEPAAREGNEWGWFTHAEAHALAKPPLDVELLHMLARNELR